MAGSGSGLTKFPRRMLSYLFAVYPRVMSLNPTIKDIIKPYNKKPSSFTIKWSEVVVELDRPLALGPFTMKWLRMVMGFHGLLKLVHILYQILQTEVFFSIYHKMVRLVMGFDGL